VSDIGISGLIGLTVWDINRAYGEMRR